MTSIALNAYVGLQNRLKQLRPTGCRDSSLAQQYHREAVLLEQEMSELYYTMTFLERDYVNKVLLRDRVKP